MNNHTPRAIRLLLKLWPFPRGAGRLVNLLFSNLRFEETKATVTTSDNFPLKVFLNDHIGRHIYLTGEYDRYVVEVLCNLARPGDILLDIGSNIGYVSACFLANVPDSAVVAVEPQLDILDLLKPNLAQFGPRYALYPFALSEENGEAPFNVDRLNRGASGISAIGAMTIQTRSVEQMVSDLSLKRIDLVKIDVEGHEEQVLNACKGPFGTLKPRAIIFEQHGQEAAPTGKIGAILGAMGYRIFGIRKRLTKIEFLPIKAKEDCVFNDYIAVSDQLPHAIRNLSS